jgi:polysaccharide chain length determinant protein (PEP-CTERM system associated)
MLPGRKYTPNDILTLLQKGAWILAASVFLCGFAGLLVARTLPNVVTAEAVVQVLPQRVPDAFVRPTVTSTVEERLKTIEGVIRSRTLLERMVRDFNLFPAKRTDGNLDDALVSTNAALAVEPVAGPTGRRPAPGQLSAFKVSFSYESRQTALQVTQHLTDFLINENSRMRETAADQTSQFLQSQLADAERRLREQDQRLETFRQKYSGRLPNQLDSNLQALQSARLDLQNVTDNIARDRDRKSMLERLYAGAVQDLENVAVAPAVPAGGQTSDPNALPTAGTVQQRLAAARANLAQLELKFKSEHPDVRRARSLIRDLEQQAAAEASAKPVGGSESSAPRAVSADVQGRRERLREQKEEINSLARRIATNEAQEAAIRARTADYQGRIESIPGIESEWNELTRDNLTLQENYKTLLQRSEESKISANLERRQIGEQFRTLDAPRVSMEGQGARRLQVNAGGVALGLLVGLLIIGLREFLDSTFRTEADVFNALAIPVLVAVPFAATAADVAREQRKRRLLFVAAGSALAIGAVTTWALTLWKFVV